MAIIKVVCGVIFKDGKVFICRRKPNKILGGYWEFPGGKVEPNEGFITSLNRELIEELGMIVTIGDHLKTIIHDYNDFTIELIAFKCTFLRASFILTDHDEYKWISISDLSNHKLAPADIPIAKTLCDYKLY